MVVVVVVWWWWWYRVIIVSALSLSHRDKERFRDWEIERAWQYKTYFNPISQGGYFCPQRENCPLSDTGWIWEPLVGLRFGSVILQILNSDQLIYQIIVSVFLWIVLSFHIRILGSDKDRLLPQPYLKVLKN